MLHLQAFYVVEFFRVDVSKTGQNDRLVIRDIDSTSGRSRV